MWRKLTNLSKASAQPNVLHRLQLPSVCSSYANSTNQRWSNGSSQRTFEMMMKERYMQAQHSVVIEAADKHYGPMMETCLQYGSIRHVYRHEVKSESFFLVQFHRILEARELMRSAGYSRGHGDSAGFLTNGRFLRYQSDAKRRLQQTRQFQLPAQEMKLRSWPKILEMIRAKRTHDEQIKAIHELGSLSDLSTRLRFLTALQIEEAIGGIAANARIIPFGSSVNGFGRMTSDLDMVLIFDEHSGRSTELSFASASKQSYKPSIHLGVLSKILSSWMSGITGVEEILFARVPILRFNHKIADLECDLSMSNSSGCQMSELLYTLCQVDSRVQPLVIFIRQWARVFDVSAAVQPSPSLTNFMLTCLVISFLQQSKVLPPINQLQINSTSPHQRSQNSDSLGKLLIDFFRYYSQFDFHANALSIVEGATTKRSCSGAIEIVNPMDTSHNVCYVVSANEREYFVNACKYAAEALTEKNMDIAQMLTAVTTRTFRREVKPPVSSKSELASPMTGRQAYSLRGKHSISSNDPGNEDGPKEPLKKFVNDLTNIRVQKKPQTQKSVKKTGSAIRFNGEY